MGQHRDHSGRIGKGWMPSGAKKIRLGSLVCLVAFLALTFLPLVHQCHLHGLEKLHHHHAGVEQESAPGINAPEPDEPHHSHHDADTCPICQAAAMCRYFSVPTLSLSPVLATPVLRLRETSSSSTIANPDRLTSGPRAPPISL